MGQYIPSSEHKKSWQVQAALSICTTFWDYVGTNWMGKMYFLLCSLKKWHRIGASVPQARTIPRAIARQFNQTPGKQERAVCSHSHVHDQNICRFFFFLILKGFSNVLEHRLLPGTHLHPRANCHSSDSMKQLEAGMSCSGWQSEAHSQSRWGSHRDNKCEAACSYPRGSRSRRNTGSRPAFSFPSFILSGPPAHWRMPPTCRACLPLSVNSSWKHPLDTVKGVPNYFLGDS